MITFDADPTNTKYTAANWNALVLWNLVHILSYSLTEVNFRGSRVFLTALDQVRVRIKTKYQNIDNIDGLVNAAANVIKKYEEELDFVARFYGFVNIKRSLGSWQTHASPDIDIDVIGNKTLAPRVDLKATTSATNRIIKSIKSGEAKIEDFNADGLQLEERDIIYATRQRPTWASFMMIPMKGAVYAIEKYKIKIDPMSSAASIIKIQPGELWEWDKEGKEEKKEILNPDKNLLNDLLTVANYIANGKASDDVEQIFYDARGGWHIKYK